VPKEIVDKLHAGFVKVINAPKAMKVWESQGTDVVGLNSEEFRNQLLSETELWKKLVKENNIRFKVD